MKETKKDILWRVYVVYLFLCLFALGIIAQICRLQFVESSYWRAKADSLTLAYQKIQPARGNIFSADGSLLATSVPVYDIRIDFRSEAISVSKFSEKTDSLALLLSSLFKDRTKEDYKKFLKRGKKESLRYALLKKNVTYAQLIQLRKFPVFKAGRYKGGLIVEQKSRRERPFRSLAARTIGYTVPGVLPVGLEGAFDEYLKGKNGVRLMQKISGNVWKPVSDESEIEPKEGDDIITTIDINIQDVAENALEAQLKLSDAESGCAVLMEVATGNIKAIANLKRAANGTYKEDYNSAIGRSSEPGSTFKLASLLAAIEDGYVDLDDTVDTQKGVVYWTSGRPMKDSHNGGYGRISVKHAFEVSSNVGISKIISRYYSKNPQAFIDRLRKMNVGEPLKLQIGGEGLPVIKNVKNTSWSRTTLPYMSIGYECQLTPLQILSFYNAIANNGKLIRPRLVNEIRQKGKLIKSFPVEVLNESVCSPSTIAKAKVLLEGVVENGTAANLKNPEYSIAGKTGTARMANGNAGYDNGGVKHQASFVGYFPAENPKYSCIVVVYAPSKNIYYAALVAGPVFKEIADKVYATNIEMHKELREDPLLIAKNLPFPKPGSVEQTQCAYNMLGMSSKFKMDVKWMTCSSKNKINRLQELKISDNTVPDVIGMGMRDAVYLLESQGLQVTTTGNGTVSRQSLFPGSKINVKGEQIIIELI